MIKTTLRLPLLAMAIICLFLGLWAGLSRIGWNVPVLPVTAHHGAVMIGGFLGSLISLEKIIPLKKKLLLLIPLLSAVSVAFFMGNQYEIAIILLISSSAGLCFAFAIYLTTERNRIYLLMLMGAVSWLIGNLLLLSTHFYPLAFPWWVAFILLIIAAERIELMKFLPIGKLNKNFFTCLVLLFPVGVLFPFHGNGNLICGSSLAGASIWLLRFDLIGINMTKSGLSKYVATALLAGYIALFMTGIFFFTVVGKMMGYDLLIHSFFIGFTFSMIFAHGPMILPGVLGIPNVKPYHNTLYVWLITLHVSWILRAVGDITMLFEMRKISGLITSFAIMGYFITLAVITLHSQRHAKVF